MSLFADALSLGFGAAEDVAGEPITYTYSDGTVVRDIIGVPGKSDAGESSPGGKVLVAIRSNDWQIRKGLLPKEPTRGDTIETADGRVYMAQPALGGPVWQWSDTNETFYRIHCVKAKKK